MEGAEAGVIAISIRGFRPAVPTLDTAQEGERGSLLTATDGSNPIRYNGYRYETHHTPRSRKRVVPERAGGEDTFSMFDNLSDKLQRVFKNLRGEGA